MNRLQDYEQEKMSRVVQSMNLFFKRGPRKIIDFLGRGRSGKVTEDPNLSGTEVAVAPKGAPEKS